MEVDFLAVETAAKGEEDFEVDGLAFPGETDEGDGPVPGMTVAVPETGTGMTVAVGLAPGCVTVYTTVPVTTDSVVVYVLRWEAGQSVTVAGQAVIVTTRVDKSVEVEILTPPEPVGGAVAVTGQTVVETTMVSVTTEVERAGQSVTVVGQAVMVLVRVEKMVEVVEPREAVPVGMLEVTVVKDDPEPVDVRIFVQGREVRVCLLCVRCVLCVLLVETVGTLKGEVLLL